MTGPHPAVAAVRVAVRTALSGLPAGAGVLVACSGGADSLALAAATAFVAPRARLRAGAVVVDHGLLPDSAEVAARAAARCRDLGLAPVDVVRVQVPDGPGSGGPEAAARDARYAALDDAARRHDAAVVLLGHTADDQAETVLLGLARGSGGRSLAGMPRRRGLLLRPLLGVRRSTTEAACAAAGLDPWQDPTNTPSGPTTPLRTRVRHEVVPVLAETFGPGVVDALARTADLLREDADLLDALAVDVLARARAAAARGTDGVDGPDGVREGSAGTDGLAVAVLADAPAPLRRRALRTALVEAGAPAGSLHRVHVLAAEALVLDWRGQGPVAVPGGLVVRRRCGRLTVDVGPRQGAGSGGPVGHG